MNCLLKSPQNDSTSYIKSTAFRKSTFIINHLSTSDLHSNAYQQALGMVYIIPLSVFTRRALNKHCKEYHHSPSVFIARLWLLVYFLNPASHSHTVSFKSPRPHKTGRCLLTTGHFRDYYDNYRHVAYFSPVITTPIQNGVKISNLFLLSLRNWIEYIYFLDRRSWMKILCTIIKKTRLI